MTVALSSRSVHRHPPRATSLIAGDGGARGDVCGLSIIHGPLPKPETRPRLLALGSIRYIRGPISSPRMRRRSRRGATTRVSLPLTFMGNRASAYIDHRTRSPIREISRKHADILATWLSARSTRDDFVRRMMNN